MIKNKIIRGQLFFALTWVFLQTNGLFAQEGGKFTYSFLDLASSARTTALGGTLISVVDEDLSLAFHNPAMLNEKTNRGISFNHNFHFLDINNGFVSYGWMLEKQKLFFHTGIQYMNYGEFKSADGLGNQTGNFTGSDYAFIVGASKQLNKRFQLGLNTKLIYSHIESYFSTGLAFDLGAIYQIQEKNLTLGMVARNIGFQIKSYNDERENLPLDLQLSVSKKLEHLPFRYAFTAHHLQTWDLTYLVPVSTENTLGNETEPKAFGQFTDKLFRHFIISGEFLLGKKENLQLRFAYNHMLKRELSVNPFKSLTGFSGGFGLKIKQFSFSYGFGRQHIHGSTQHISIRTDLDRFSKRNKA